MPSSTRRRASPTAARIDEFYAELAAQAMWRVGVGGGDVARVRVVLRSALAQAVRWEWFGTTRPCGPIGSPFRRGSCSSDGPVLADTKTKRSHAVDLDPGTCEILAGYVARV